jgi:hypothetical protein
MLIDRLKNEIEMYPWLKSHGSIEARLFEHHYKWHLQYPWLKSHGSIEAS